MVPFRPPYWDKYELKWITIMGLRNGHLIENCINPDTQPIFIICFKVATLIDCLIYPEWTIATDGEKWARVLRDAYFEYDVFDPSDTDYGVKQDDIQRIIKHHLILHPNGVRDSL